MAAHAELPELVELQDNWDSFQVTALECEESRDLGSWRGQCEHSFQRGGEGVRQGSEKAFWSKTVK